MYTLPILILFLSCTTDDSEPSETDQPLTIATTTYGGGQIDTFHSITATTDGGFAAMGATQSTDGDITDNSQSLNKYWLTKFASSGDLEWSKTYGGTDDDRGEHVIQTADGGFALAGYSKSNDGDVSGNNGFHDQWVLKTDATGTIQWEANFGFSGSDQLTTILQTRDGGYLTAGFLDVTASGGEGNSTRHGVGEFWIHKLDTQGKTVWRKFYGGTNNDRAYDILETSDGILVIGASESNDFDITNAKGSYDFWALKLDNNGDLLWQQNYGGSEIDIAYTATKTTDGHFILAGDSRSADGDLSTNKGNADLFMIKIDAEGRLVWSKTLGGSSFDTARDIITVADGFVLVGSSRSADGDLSNNQGQNDVWILKTDFNGTIVWQKTIGGSGIDFGYGIAQDSQGNYIIAGDTQSLDGDIETNKGASDGLIIKIIE